MDRHVDVISFCMRRKYINTVLKAAELPPETDPHLFFVQWIGSGDCLVEQHRGIICLEQKKICFATEQGILSVSGEMLELEQMTESRAKIRGLIRSVSVEGKS